MNVRLISGVASTSMVSHVEVNTVEHNGTLNVNPDFGLGPDNYSGWQRIASGGKLIERDGKTILDTKYGSVGQRISLKETGTYALSAIATGIHCSMQRRAVLIRSMHAERQHAIDFGRSSKLFTKKTLVSFPLTGACSIQW